MAKILDFKRVQKQERPSVSSQKEEIYDFEKALQAYYQKKLKEANVREAINRGLIQELKAK